MRTATGSEVLELYQCMAGFPISPAGGRRRVRQPSSCSRAPRPGASHAPERVSALVPPQRPNGFYLFVRMLRYAYFPDKNSYTLLRYKNMRHDIYFISSETLQSIPVNTWSKIKVPKINIQRIDVDDIESP